jgi:hypothetical protein
VQRDTLLVSHTALWSSDLLNVGLPVACCLPPLSRVVARRHVHELVLFGVANVAVALASVIASRTLVE